MRPGWIGPVLFLRRLVFKMRFRLGDVVELATRNGLGYIQLTHNVAIYGSLWRILPGLFVERPQDLASLVGGPELYFVFVPPISLSRSPQAVRVGNFVIPNAAQNFPLFKAPFYLDAAGRKIRWWLWDGEKEWPVDKLTPSQEKLSTRQVVTVEQLQEDLARDHRPEDDL
jgi:hypothetical protein